MPPPPGQATATGMNEDARAASAEAGEAAPAVAALRPGAHHLYVRLSATATAVLLCIAWILPGLVGHEPWKPDEAEVFGVAHNLVSGRGDWIVPRLAGEPYLESPPLAHVVGAGFARAFSFALPLHDAARLATAVFMALTFLLVALTAQELFGREYRAIAAVGLLGCVGLLVRAHQLIPGVPLLTGFALALYALAIAARRPLLAGVALGTGMGIGFLARGLVAPVMLSVLALALFGFFRAWRTPRFLGTLGVAAASAAPWLLIWPIALYQRSEALFRQWLSQDSFAVFLGMAKPAHAFHEYFELLPWYAWPVLPLALWTVWRWRHRVLKEPQLQLPLAAFVVMFVMLAMSATASDIYALPLLLPLTLLAVASLDTLRRGAISALDWFGIMTFGLFSLVIWIAWVALLTGWPAKIAAQLAAYQPGFDARFSWPAFIVAATCSLLWLALIARAEPTTRRALVNWAGGITLMWILAMTLWLPFVDAGKSYRSLVVNLQKALPKERTCISSIGLGDSQRAMLEYYAGIVTFREERPQAKRDCDLLLTQGTVAQEREVGPGWKRIWEGSRPGDNKERFRLYKRVARKP